MTIPQTEKFIGLPNEVIEVVNVAANKKNFTPQFFVNSLAENLIITIVWRNKNPNRISWLTITSDEKQFLHGVSFKNTGQRFSIIVEETMYYIGEMW